MRELLSLQVGPCISHHNRRLILLSRIDGDAPRAKRLAPDVWMVREQVCFTHRSRSCLRASEPDSSNAAVRRRQIRFAASFHFLNRGKGFVYVKKTLCWEPRFPNYQSGFTRTVCEIGR